MRLQPYSFGSEVNLNSRCLQGYFGLRSRPPITWPSRYLVFFAWLQLWQVFCTLRGGAKSLHLQIERKNMEIDTQLMEAKDRMREAAKHLMTTPVPRDTNRAWKHVAMQYSETFVNDHYRALQQAFNDGLSAT